MTTKPERAAVELLRRLSVERPPVQPSAIAERLGVRVLEQPLEEEVSGMIYRSGVTPLILVNAHDHDHRKRFSIAHELGHYVLHESDLVFVDSRLRRDYRAGLGIDPKEIDANQFAAALLMPRDWVLSEVNRRRSLRRVPEDEELINQLARCFRVSNQAMEHRLANLGILGTF